MKNLVTSISQRAMIVPRVRAPRSWVQLGILVRDSSPSMGGPLNPEMSKAQAVNIATQELLRELAASSRQANFLLSVIDFNTTARLRFAPITAGALDASADYALALAGGTSIAAGLSAVAPLVAAFYGAEAEWDVPVSVCIVVLSDGLDHDPDQSLAIARKLLNEPRTRICSTLFAPPAEEDDVAAHTLRALTRRPASDYRRIADATTLRRFFFDSVSAVAWEGGE